MVVVGGVNLEALACPGWVRLEEEGGFRDEPALVSEERTLFFGIKGSPFVGE